MAKGRRVWVGLVLLTLLGLLFSRPRGMLQTLGREAVFPLENGVSWLNSRVFDPVSRLWRAAGVDRRNAMLEREIERLRVDGLLLEQLERENATLRLELDLPPRTQGRVQTAFILSKGGSAGWWRNLRINRGYADGVRVGDVVLSSDGLVGRVRMVDRAVSEVLLITDPMSRISCQLDPIDPDLGAIRGVLQGDGWRAGSPGAPEFLYVIEPLRLRYLERDIVPSPRTRIVTSGLGGKVPAGLLVGYLLESRIDEHGLYRIGAVMPAADLASLSVVYVVSETEAE